MPPHAAAAAPFRTETLLSTLMPDEVGLMRMPDMQFVVVVTPCTQPLAVPKNRMPSPWNRWTTPGPRTPTLLWPFGADPRFRSDARPLAAGRRIVRTGNREV